MKNYAESKEYKADLLKYDYIFSEKYHIKDETISLTPLITLEINYFHHSEGDNSIGCQMVTLKNDTDGILFHNKTVWGHLFYQYIKHANGKEYFITGSGLEVYVLYNISENVSMKYVRGNTADKKEFNGGAQYWYLVDLKYNPGNNMVAVNGHDLLNCSRISVFEFKDESSFPFRFHEISGLIFDRNEGENHVAKQWLDGNFLQVEVTEQHRNILLLSEAEISNYVANKHKL